MSVPGDVLPDVPCHLRDHLIVAFASGDRIRQHPRPVRDQGWHSSQTSDAT